MTRRTLISLLLMFCVSISAESNSVHKSKGEFRVGYVDMAYVINSLEEVRQLREDYDSLENEYEFELNLMIESYNDKVKKYLLLDKNLNSTIRNARQAEITEMELRIEKYKISYLKALADYKDQVMFPVNELFKLAVEKVSSEKGINIVFDKGTPIYVDATCIDISEAVLTYLRRSK